MIDFSINYWEFIGQYLPKYHADNRVLMSDILFKYINDEEMSEEDIMYVEREYHNKDVVLKELKRLDLELLEESLDAFYKELKTCRN